MSERTVSGTLLTLLLTSVFVLAFNIQPVGASGTIYIRADGSIDPPTSPIFTTDGVTYTFIDDINDSIVIERDNIVVDGAGFAVQGTGEYGSIGIDLSNRVNVTVRNTRIIAFYYGVYLNYSSNNSLSGNDIAENNYDGIWLGSSSNYNSMFVNNITANSHHGIYLDSASDNKISGNSIANNYDGIGLYSSSDNNISGNNITDNNLNGIWLASSNYNSISGNNITNNNANGIWFVSSNHTSIIGNNIANNNGGIYLSTSSDNNIRENDIANNYDGVWLGSSSNNIIYHNNFVNNTYQAYSYPLINVWDNRYPSGGNYWSDYAGVDVKSGPHQDQSTSDGIGDTPYVINIDNKDRYPLMNPYVASPPPTYALIIMVTAGGTTNPTPGTYNYAINSLVRVKAMPNANSLFDHWELDSVNVGSANPYTLLIDKSHTLKAVFSLVSISPLSASIKVSRSVTFTSTVSGGYKPYSYQWYLNGNPVSGAILDTWKFTPTEAGICYVYLKVTDFKGNTAQSDTAHIAVECWLCIGGYSVSRKGQTTNPMARYLTLIAILTIGFTTIKRRTAKKTKKP